MDRPPWALGIDGYFARIGSRHKLAPEQWFSFWGNRVSPNISPKNGLGDFFCCKFPVAHFPHILMYKQISPQLVPLDFRSREISPTLQLLFCWLKNKYLRVQNTSARRNFYRITLGFTKIFVGPVILVEYFVRISPSSFPQNFLISNIFPKAISPKNAKPKISPKYISPKIPKIDFP